MASINHKDLMQHTIQAVNNMLNNAMLDTATEVVARAEKEREFVQFTGNTVSSYTAIVFNKKNARQKVQAPRNIVHSKIAKGQTVRLSKPVEGQARALQGSVNLTTAYGPPLAEKTAIQQISKTKGHVGMVVATGTEYSEFLEDVRELDVLSNTYNVTTDIFTKNIIKQNK